MSFMKMKIQIAGLLLLSPSISCAGQAPAADPSTSDHQAVNSGTPPTPVHHATPTTGSACLKEGQEAVDSSARFPGEVSPRCCEGLHRIPVYDTTSLEHGQCIVSKGDRVVCTHCGDEECALGENHCNCDDCR